MKNLPFKFLICTAMGAAFFASCTAPTGSGPGCINPDAVNYNSGAAYDDGSCVVIEQKSFSLFFQYASQADPDCNDVNFNSVFNANSGKVLGIRLPQSDFFSWAGNDSVRTIFQSQYAHTAALPEYVSNETFQGVNFANANADITNRFAVAPEGGIGIYFTVGGGVNAGMLNINLYVKFFSPQSQYYAGIYVLQKSIVGVQNVGGTPDTNFVQKHVLLAPVTRVFGEAIPSGEVSSGNVYHKGYIFPYTSIPNINTSSLEVVGILWRKTGSTYKVVNVTPNPN
jgi:hypothetical protein